jgi:hypothetical protein
MQSESRATDRAIDRVCFKLNQARANGVARAWFFHFIVLLRFGATRPIARMCLTIFRIEDRPESPSGIPGSGLCRPQVLTRLRGFVSSIPPTSAGGQRIAYGAGRSARRRPALLALWHPNTFCEIASIARRCACGAEIG